MLRSVDNVFIFLCSTIGLTFLNTLPRAEDREGRRVDITYTPDYGLIGRDPTGGKCLIIWHPRAGQEDRVTSIISLIRICSLLNQLASLLLPSSILQVTILSCYVRQSLF